MINPMPILKSIWEFSKPAVSVAGQVLIGVGTVVAAGKVYDGIASGVSRIRKGHGVKKATVRRKTTAKKNVAKKS